MCVCARASPALDMRPLDCLDTPGHKHENRAKIGYIKSIIRTCMYSLYMANNISEKHETKTVSVFTARPSKTGNGHCIYLKKREIEDFSEDDKYLVTLERIQTS